MIVVLPDCQCFCSFVDESYDHQIFVNFSLNKDIKATVVASLPLGLKDRTEPLAHQAKHAHLSLNQQSEQADFQETQA